MKSIVLNMGAAYAFGPNQLPIMPTLPGWKLGTEGAQIDLRLFYDLMCPDSRDAHYALKTLLT